MKRLETESIGDVLRRTLEEAGMTGRLDELKAADLWPLIVGPWIASRTLRPYVKAGVMQIRVMEAPLRHELHMLRSTLLAEINRHIGKEVIREIRFIS